MGTLGWISPPTFRPRYRSNRNAHMHRRYRLLCSVPPPASPWLMLRPSETAYKMYSLAEERVLSLKKSRHDVLISEKNGEGAAPVLVGSSHGWLAFFDEKSQHIFLSNPISGGHIKLPRSPWSWPCRVILSCAPTDDEAECYAVLANSDPAFCHVGVSDEWTQLDVPILYDDAAYCSTRKVFSFITPSKFDFDPYGIRVAVLYDYRHLEHQIDHWEISSSKEIMKRRPVDSTWFWALEGPPHSWKENEDAELLANHCSQKLHLVHYHYDDDDDHLPLIVVQFKMNCAETRGFLVLQIDKRGGIKVVEDLKGVAIFVGMNHSFAINANGTMLKPNSIYFTPTKAIMDSFISNDVGIFDYHNKTFSPLHLDLQFHHHHHAVANFKNGPHPMWFTPNPA